MPRGSADASALRDLLLVPGILRGLAVREPPARIPTGVDTLDALLGGGLPRGALTEIVGRPSAGRTTLACTLLRAVTARHDLAACIDPQDTLDAPHAESAGVDLSRVLWVRPRTARDALRAALHVLDARPLVETMESSGARETVAFASLLAQLHDRIERHALDGLRPAMQWLLMHQPPSPARPVICHGDFHPQNVMMVRGVVTGVLDWPNALV